MQEKHRICQQLLEAWSTCPVINTHSHHLPDHEDQRLDLSRLIQQSYINWIMPKLSWDQAADRRQFFTTYRFNSYATWLVRAIEELYPLGSPLSLDTWDDYDQVIRKAHRDPEHHLKLLSGSCRYEAVILDQYRDPGSDNGHPEIFRPTFRCDAFFNGYDRLGRDDNGVSPYDMLDVPQDLTLPEYLGAVRQAIKNAKQQDAVALKIAIAYERDLDFQPVDLDKAARGFLRQQSTDLEIRHFQDYLVDQLMIYAAEFDLPVQFHTGLGQLKGTRAMGLCDLISRHPEVRFDLFHGSFPWTDDILALAHNYRHVYVDLCWLPILSTRRAVSFIQEALEVTDASRIVWGCDTWTSEESYGALLAVRYALAEALSELMAVHQLQEKDAVMLGRRILADNARQLFRL